MNCIGNIFYLQNLTKKYMCIFVCECLCKLRLVDHLSTNNLLNSFQSAYIKHHSDETTLMSVHDHIIKAMSHQQVTLSHTS